MFIAPRQVHRFIQYLSRVMVNRERVVDEFQLRLGNSGPAIDVRVDGLRVHGAECRMALIDISAQKRAEAQARAHREALLHAARLATLGELASGIAHEISQPLGAIGSYAQALSNIVQSEPEANPQLKPTVDKMLAQVERAGDILHRVRAFARREKVERTREDIVDVIQEAHALMEPALEKNQVGVRVHRQDVALKPLIDRVQIIQVFANLISNATEAMADNDPEDREIVIEVAMPDRDRIEVAVKDHGDGLPLGDYDKLFMPFFSTGRNGLGLGLSLSHSIIEAHGGRMWAHANTPRGMVFRFTLPVFDKDHDNEH
jgi:two-component system sensor kinase FixL